MSERTKLCRVELQISPQLKEALDAAAGNGSRNALIEEIMWGSKRVRDAARDLGISKPPTRKMGRPKKETK